MRRIDADKLLETIEKITWYSTNKDGVLHMGSTSDRVSYYRCSDITSAIDSAMTVDSTEVKLAMEIIRRVQGLMEDFERHWNDQSDYYHYGYYQALADVLVSIRAIEEEQNENMV